jgi:hypothetical protein
MNVGSFLITDAQSAPQGIPLRRTNTMPLRQARSGTRGRPPFSPGFAGDKRGSIKSHKPSGTKSATTMHLRRRVAFRFQHMPVVSLNRERRRRGMLCGSRGACDRYCVIASRGTMRPAVVVIITISTACCLHQHSSEQEEGQQ